MDVREVWNMQSIICKFVTENAFQLQMSGSVEHEAPW